MGVTYEISIDISTNEQEAMAGIQGIVNKVKSTAREFADSMTPVLKVRSERNHVH